MSLLAAMRGPCADIQRMRRGCTAASSRRECGGGVRRECGGSAEGVRRVGRNDGDRGVPIWEAPASVD
jgi:hypothetical protein